MECKRISAVIEKNQVSMGPDRKQILGSMGSHVGHVIN